MDLRHIETFLIAAETSSYRETARRRGLSQPAVSQQIHSIEGETGLTLFVRKGRGVELTPAGATMREAFRRVSLHAGDMFRIAGMLRRQELGMISVGYSTSLMFEEKLPQVLRGFSEAHPTVDLQINPMRVQDAIDALSDNQIDLAILRGPVPPLPPDLGSAVFTRSPLVLAVPEGHALSRLEHAEVTDLEGQIVMTMADPPGVGLRHTTEMLLARHRTTPAELRMFPDMTTLTGLVSAGMGVAILPEQIANAKLGVTVVKFGRSAPCSEGVVAFPKSTQSVPLRHLIRRLGSIS